MNESFFNAFCIYKHLLNPYSVQDKSLPRCKVLLGLFAYFTKLVV